ncbi:MAG TPA: acyl-CoA dehydrogenase family protein [Solirubrobacteraceae bacterium]|nr:acyl-CoA dehydrogenase family protein [Solirubrobacteraceae bacterium]
MNLALSDEQEFLREAARGALSRYKTIEAARDALEGGELPDLWAAAVEAGWPGLLVSEQRGGAGLGAFDAMLVMQECGRVLASVPLLGHVVATAVLEAAEFDGLSAYAAGERRAVFLPARPPGDIQGGWTVDEVSGAGRAAAPVAQVSGSQAQLTGTVPWVIDAPGADLFVVVALDGGGEPVGVAVEGAQVEPATRYDATRLVGHVTLDGTTGTVLDVTAEQLANAWYLAQVLLAAESLGAVETALESSVAYAKERFTFGRAIGSYQAVKHALTEVLRLQENTRSLLYYAGWARNDAPHEFPLAASAARASGGRALDFAARELISVHGGIGATWEHDAPLFFRRAQLSRRLLGGTADATDRVAGELLSSSAAA